MKPNLYLIEFYTIDPKTREEGWDINFAWVHAADSEEARAKLAANQGSRFDRVIQTTQQSEIFPLAGDFRVNTPDANLFIIP